MRRAKRIGILWCCMGLLFMPTHCAHAQLLFSFSQRYRPSEAALVNPYMGNLAWANDLSAHEQPFTLVYADLTWKEFEPKEGFYDFDTFEKNNNLAMWRAQGKHVVFRFVLDMPGTSAHRDIPDWLYRATGKDGKKYHISYGKGYSPNYENPLLIARHREAIAALGARYGDDPLFAFVELGSLGHWGEWHTHPKLPPMPLEDIRDAYIAPYVDAFPAAHLLFRRPFRMAETLRAGLFNDTTGALESTMTWLGWIEAGGAYNETGEPDALVPMPDAWKRAPIGGELATSMTTSQLLQENFEQTCTLLAQSHTSWIGPGSFVDVSRDGQEQMALDRLLRQIGYRFYVSRLDVCAEGEQLVATLTWENDGVAPFYFDWQPVLIGKSGAQTLFQLPLALDLRTLLPGAPQTVQIAWDPRIMGDAPCSLGVAVLDPVTQTPGIALAMDVPQDAYVYELTTIQTGSMVSPQR